MSFGQEIKDFIAAAQAGQKIIGASSDEEYKKVKLRYMQAQTKTIEDKNNDGEGDKLAKDAVRARIRASDAATGLTNERRGLVKDQRGILVKPPATDPMYEAIKVTPGAVQPAVPTERVAPPPAVNPDAGMDMSEAAPLDDEVEAVPVAMAARGGEIQHFADGGEVEDDEEAEAVPDDEEAELLTPSPATDFSSRNRGTPKFSTDAAVDGAGAGLKFGVSALGPAAVSDPGRSRRLTAYARGAGAAQPIDMEAARKAVDPEGKLSESQRNLAALGAVYQYKLNKDDQAGAQRAAFSMIQHYRVASQRYAAIAAAAAEKGDLDGAARAALKAYANIPNGRDLKLEKTGDGKLKYSFTDEKTGKTLEAGIAAPDQLAAAAIGFSRDGFDQSILAAAGQRAEKPAKGKKGAVDPDAPMKAPERTAAMKGIDAAYESQNPVDPTNGEGGGTAKPARAKDEERALKGASFRMAKSNPDLTHDEVLSVATRIADPSLGKTNIVTKPAEGGYHVSLDGRKPVFVTADDMVALRTRRKARETEIAKKAAEDAKPGFAQRAAGAIGDMAAPVGDYFQSLRTGTRKEGREEEARRKTFTEPQIP